MPKFDYSYTAEVAEIAHFLKNFLQLTFVLKLIIDCELSLMNCPASGN